jgi:site-specific recombinase XerD
MIALAKEVGGAEALTLPPPVTLEAQARCYREAARAKNTIRGYRCDWSNFTAWCITQDRTSLPATSETVALYLTAQAAHLKPQSLGRRVASIAVAHKTAGYASPTASADVRLTLSGIRRLRSSPAASKTALQIEDVRRIAAALGPSLRDVRDRALLLLGFAAGLRRSELVAIDVENLNLTAEGIQLTLMRSKTDQDGVGRLIAVPRGSSPLTCPLAAIKTWLEKSSIENGAVYRTIDRHERLQPSRLSDKGAARAIKRLCRLVGLPNTEYGAHSLRSGFATSAARAGASEHAIALVTGHRSTLMLRRYIRRGQLWEDNAISRLGL